MWQRRCARRPDAGDAESLDALDADLADVDWQTLPAGSRSFRFDAPSGSLAAVAFGNPTHPRVVLVPGATGSKEDFILLGPLLAAAGYYVESYDLAGQYGSAAAAAPAGESYDYDFFVADLLAFLHAGTVPAHVLGYSFAGFVVQEALVAAPELFASVAFLGVPPQPGQSFRGVSWIGPLSYLTTPHRIAGLLIWGVSANLNRATPGRVELVRERFEFTSRRSVDEIVRLMKHAPDRRRELVDSGIPLLVAVGRHDIWPTRLQRENAELIGAVYREYPTGHSPCETTPHRLAADLVALYARAESRSA
ncbi:alpha/beta fold hydrolase [Glaciibacter psychrotolerans]|nr:alpha/beta hydrolase [Leifsonia psychrotolerans]